MTAPDALRNLGVRVTAAGGELRVWSEAADAMELCIYDDNDPFWIVRTIPMHRGAENVWSARSRTLVPGRRYGIRVSGPMAPTHAFRAEKTLIDPYAKGLIHVGSNEWRSVVVDDTFDWQGVAKPATPLERTVIYEAHVKGMSNLNPDVPPELRGSYAGLAHKRTIAHLKDLGVTAVELLPVHAFVSERRLVKQGLTNYWGYNTLNFFSPHAGYASIDAQQAGPQAILDEFKGMVRALHAAGLEVILDVVFNHTAEEQRGTPTITFRGIDNAAYYRQGADGAYIDVTGCGNTLNTGHAVPARLVLDALRYWANEVQVDGFRFDLAVALGRDENTVFHPDHELLTAIRDDPALAGVKLIAEPWDLGPDGWQTGSFPAGWSEWNDHFRDRMRAFWLADLHATRSGATAGGLGAVADRLTGSADVFTAERSPLASVNFVTAHDGFTLADLVTYNVKHNIGNGESNRDGTDNNASYNHGAEGITTDPAILAGRRRSMRNLLGSLLLSAGVPMITAGDEFGRSQRGNNNPYCRDSELTWLDWNLEPWQQDLYRATRALLTLRRRNPALRPSRVGIDGESVPGAAHVDWYDEQGQRMSPDAWGSARTVQYAAATDAGAEPANAVLLVVHGQDRDETVTLPRQSGIRGYTLAWDSARDEETAPETLAPGAVVPVSAMSLQLFVVS
ncbi:glycogen debranching protein GlgX [Cryobacterium tepidiphilum]|uniref:Glycogen debranching enzyme GlgX n=1 Tax=Cryobacterium tepidiphilum TaxID=2486026 RepID=A0A3M8L386_9MICO|nr:glycogen debranching protein GlgX [Cryobacterium tepidiphilum]RNE59168.1 glycogen debranching enzyme GlgX [Cryobacterium tepidiphilum]